MEALDKKRQTVFWVIVFFKRALKLNSHTEIHYELSPDRIKTEAVAPLLKVYEWTPALERRLENDKVKLGHAKDARMFLQTEIIQKFSKEDRILGVIYLLKLASAKELGAVYRAVIDTPILRDYILDVLGAIVGWGQAEELNCSEYIEAYEMRKSIIRICKIGGAAILIGGAGLFAFRLYQRFKKTGGTA